MGPAGVTPSPGSAKPNGGGSKATRAANAEKGYRVCSTREDWNDTTDSRPGQVFSTPDLATQCARKRAKAEQTSYVVIRNGVRWKVLRKDGEEDVIE